MRILLPIIWTLLVNSIRWYFDPAQKGECPYPQPIADIDAAAERIAGGPVVRLLVSWA